MDKKNMDIKNTGLSDVKKTESKNNSFENVIGSLVKGVEGFLSAKTVVGEPVIAGDTTILPLMELSFGLGAGSGNGDKNDRGCGGIGGKMTPSAVLIINESGARLISIKNQDTVNKIVDMVPDFLDRFTVKKSGAGGVSNEEACDIAFPKEDEEI